MAKRRHHLVRHWDDRRRLAAQLNRRPKHCWRQLCCPVLPRPMSPGAHAGPTYVTFRHLFAQSIVSDHETAEGWYTALFHSSPQARPMDGLLEWHLGDSFGVQVWRDPDRAGHSTIVLDVSDLDALAARLTAAGINHDGPQPVTASRLLLLSDPDGNQVAIRGA